MVASINSLVLTAKATPVVDTNAYQTGDVMGGKIELSSVSKIRGGTGSIRKVLLHCKSSQDFDFDVVFFREDPAATTFTNNAAVAVHANDAQKVIGFAKAIAANWCDIGTPSLAQIDVDIPFDLTDGFGLYACIIVRDAATLVSTSDLTLEVASIPD